MEKDLTYTERWRKVNNEWSPQYVIDLIQSGAPLWIIVRTTSEG